MNRNLETRYADFLAQDAKLLAIHTNRKTSTLLLKAQVLSNPEYSKPVKSLKERAGNMCEDLPDTNKSELLNFARKRYTKVKKNE